MQPSIQTIGDRIRRCREALRLSQEELGTAAGISAAAISQIENGITKAPKPENLLAIAKRLGKSIEWLISGEGFERDYTDMLGAITELPDDNPRLSLDLLEDRWHRAEGLVASDKIARYLKMIDDFKRDLEKRRGGG